MVPRCFRWSRGPAEGNVRINVVEASEFISRHLRGTKTSRPRVRWVHSLREVPDRLPSSVPPARGARLPSAARNMRIQGDSRSIKPCGPSARARVWGAAVFRRLAFAGQIFTRLPDRKGAWIRPARPFRGKICWRERLPVVSSGLVWNDNVTGWKALLVAAVQDRRRGPGKPRHHPVSARDHLACTWNLKATSH